LPGPGQKEKRHSKRIDPEAEVQSSTVALISGICVGGRAADADVEKMGEDISELNSSEQGFT
jgi:hypothetical protein